MSTTGTDSASCTTAAPCRSLAAAIAATVANGEVYCLTSGGYGTVTITKAIAIVCDRVDAALSATANGAAVTIQAGSSDKILLQGLHLAGGGTGGYGVNVVSAGPVLIEQSVIGGFAGNPGVAVNVVPPSGAARVTVDHSQIIGNVSGIVATGSDLQMALNNSLIGGNSGTAIAVTGTGSAFSGQGAGISLEHAQITGNGTAFTANGSAGGALIELGNSLVGGNPGYMSTNGSFAFIYSAGNNQIVNNSGGTFTQNSGIGPGPNTGVYTNVGTQ